MKARSRRQLEMGRRAFAFSRAHPDGNPGYETALAALGSMLDRADLLADQQRNGVVDVSIATRRKNELRRSIQQGHLKHLIRVARRAEKELPGISQRFRLKLTGGTLIGFRAAARGMLAEATARKEALMRHGMSATVLDGLAAALAQFDEAVQQGMDGRRAHTGASTDLSSVANEIVQLVRVMDGLNRVRFAGDEELLPAWERASSVFATPKVVEEVPVPEPGTESGEVPPAGGEVRPAA
jgi:hypothetical protein